MAAIAFQVEIVQPQLGLVIVRQLDARRFRVVAQTRLNGCPVLAMTLPPTKDVDMLVRDDVHAFRLRNREDAQRFKVGERVELSDWREEPARR